MYLPVPPNSPKTTETSSSMQAISAQMYVLLHSIYPRPQMYLARAPRLHCLTVTPPPPPAPDVRRRRSPLQTLLLMQMKRFVVCHVYVVQAFAHGCG